MTKATHVLARVRHSDNKDSHDVIELPEPTAQYPEAVAQVNDILRDWNKENRETPKSLIDLDMLEPGQEKRHGVNAPLVSEIATPSDDTSVQAAQRNAITAAGAKAAVEGTKGKIRADNEAKAEADAKAKAQADAQAKADVAAKAKAESDAEKAKGAAGK